MGESRSDCMKNKVKKKITKMIKTLEEANEILKALIHNHHHNEMIELLTMQQELMIAIGNSIEESEGGRHASIKLLEDYCELVWQLSQQDDSNQAEYMRNILVESLVMIKKELNKISVKYEIVFIPYLASMWDSMETVWQAAREDPNCVAHVMPIPYFDKLSNGSFGEEHYEGNQFPKEVPIVDYRSYDLSVEQPDIIYIHNPYDDKNLVSTVHPNYYSRKLKQYTDTLIYIPYFLTQEHLPEAHRLLSAYIYADYIIVQNDTMKNEVDSVIPREKIIVGGSPKAERIQKLAAQKEKLPIPLEWKKKIKGKKVILLNTSISSILNEGEKRFDKVEETLDLIKDSKDFVVIWRPHPLLEATLDSMRPELAIRFERLKKRIKQERLAIIDTTKDPNISVVISDAYIGEDSSSIVDLFRVLEKPRLLQSTERYTSSNLDDIKKDYVMDVCRVSDELWFVTGRLQLLCKYSLKTEKFEVVAEIPDMDSLFDMRYVSITSYEDNVILVPYRADALCIYNTSTKEFTKYYFKDEGAYYNFGRVINYKQYLYLTPIDYPSLVRFDMLTKQFEYFTECIQELHANIENIELCHPILWGVAALENELVVGSIVSNRVLLYNMETNDYIVQEVGEKDNKYRGVTIDGDDCYFIQVNKSEVVKWNKKTYQISVINEYPKDFIPGDVPFKNIVNFEDKIYLVPFYANHMCVLDKENGTITYDETLSWDKTNGDKTFFCHFGKKISNQEMSLFLIKDNNMVVFDIAKKSYTSFSLKIEDAVEVEERKRKRYLIEQWEIEDYSIERYLEIVKKNIFKPKRRRGELFENKEVECVGKKIYEEVLTRVL